MYERFAVTASAARRPAATFVAAAAPLCLSFSLFPSFTHAADDAALPMYVLRFKTAIVPRRENQVLSRHRGDGSERAATTTTMTPRRRPRGPRLPSLSVSLVPVVPLSLQAASHYRCYYYYYYYGHHRRRRRRR